MRLIWCFVGGGIFSFGKNLSNNATNNTYSVEDSRVASDTWENHAATSFAGGTGAENDPWLISSAEELAYLAKTCNNGEMYSGKYFKQTADIYLGGYDWVSIGGIDANDGAFRGIYDGANFSISNIYINWQGGHPGLFGYVGYCTIKNIRIKASTIKNTSDNYDNNTRAGGIAALADNGAKIDNCHVEANIFGGRYVGGIVGHSFNAEIKNCSFKGTVEGYDYVGGIVGIATGGMLTEHIVNCVNYGAVSSASHYVGGIVGQFNAYLAGATIRDCLNYGNVKTQQSNAGGIAGEMNDNDKILNCISYGIIEAGATVGGIVGQMGGSGSLVSSCAASGQVIISDAAALNAGGIVGRFRGKLENCSFIGGSNLNTAGNFYGDKYDDSATITSCYSIMNRVKGYSSNGDFSGFAVSTNFNDGYPVQRSLYHVANFMPQATRTWFAEQGFGGVKE